VIAATTEEAMPNQPPGLGPHDPYNVTLTEGGADTATGTFIFTDPDVTDIPTASQGNQTVVYQDSSGNQFALTQAQRDAFEGAFQFTSGWGPNSFGTVQWIYSIADTYLDFIGFQENVTITTPIVIDDHNGGASRRI
jgi:hypothetical protein